MARKEVKAAEISEILKNIKDGSYETFRVTGVSKAWSKFSKIRNASNKLEAPYVYCRECRGVIPFKSGFGTSNLLKHDCNKAPDREQVFKKLPAEKIQQVKKDFMDKAISFCAKEMIPAEFLSNAGFLEFAQFAITFGDQYGNINVTDVIPHHKSVNRAIAETTAKASQKVLEDFKKSFEQKRCSATIQIWSKSEVNGLQLLTFRLQYFNENLTALCKKSIFTISVEATESHNKVSQKIIQQFKIFGGEEHNLKEMKIVFPAISLISRLPFLLNGKPCAVYKIYEIFEETFFSSTIDELLSTCRSIVKYFVSHRKIDLLDSLLELDHGTWESKLAMIESISKQYDKVMSILDEDDRVNFVIDKKFADEVVFIFKPFVEAIEDMRSSGSTSCSKKVLWWAILKTHVQSTEIKSFSFEGKNISSLVKSALETEFYPTMDDKIDCFFDPQYRSLNMFERDDERAAVFNKIRSILETLPVINVVEALQTPAGSSTNEPLIQTEPPKKKSRFAKYTTTAADVGTNDEVKMYIQYADVSKLNFESEFDVIEKFWKVEQEKYPKLFQLAMMRLHVGLTCDVDNQHGQYERALKPDYLHNLMVIRDDLNT